MCHIPYGSARPIEEKTKKEKTTGELFKEARICAGDILFYLQYWRPTVDFGKQIKAVDRLCFILGRECRHHFEDTEDNRNWFKKWIDEFKEETENMI